MFLLRHSIESNKLNKNDMQKKKISFPRLFSFHLLLGWAAFDTVAHLPLRLFIVGQKPYCTLATVSLCPAY